MVTSGGVNGPTGITGCWREKLQRAGDIGKGPDWGLLGTQLSPQPSPPSSSSSAPFSLTGPSKFPSRSFPMTVPVPQSALSGVAWLGRAGDAEDTYVDLCSADIFSLLQCNEHEGREGHISLLGGPDTTLGGGRKQGPVTFCPPLGWARLFWGSPSTGKVNLLSFIFPCTRVLTLSSIPNPRFF